MKHATVFLQNHNVNVQLVAVEDIKPGDLVGVDKLRLCVFNIAVDVMCPGVAARWDEYRALGFVDSFSGFEAVTWYSSCLMEVHPSQCSPALPRCKSGSCTP